MNVLYQSNFQTSQFLKKVGDEGGGMGSVCEYGMPIGEKKIQ